MNSKEKIRKEQNISAYFPLVKRYCMKYVGSFDKKVINDHVINTEQDIIDDNIEQIIQNNIDTFSERIFMSILQGVGKYFIFHNELNLFDENFTKFNTVYDISYRLVKIQEELGALNKGNDYNFELSNRVLWLDAIKEEIFYPVIYTGLSAYISGELDLDVYDLYDKQFSSLIKKELPDDFDGEELEDYLNADDSFSDDIERKVDEEIKPKFYKVYSKIFKEETSDIENYDVLFYREEIDDIGRISIHIASSIEMQKRINLLSFWDDIYRLKEDDVPSIIIEKKNRIKERLGNELNKMYSEAYEKYKNNPELEPFKKKKMKIKIAKGLEE